MPGLAALTTIGLVAVAVLIPLLLKLRRKDLIDAIMKKRQATSKLVTRAEYVEGRDCIPVSLAVTADSLYYENPDLEASFELSRIDEIEYEDELSTGKNLPADKRVLRIRSHGAVFEFVVDRADQPKWAAALPARRLDAPTARAV
ncbi:MAG TPA: hypothetical protein VF824_05915 [Thermoanaerobaculia bacterium]|jgi:hypothetical protein